MSVTSLEKRRETTSRRGRRGELAHPECPVEQRLRGRDDSARIELSQLAWRRDEEAGSALFVADHDGLRVLAPSESVLAQAVARIARRFPGRVVVYPPAVRYVPGNPVLEPHMMVLVSGPERHLAVVQKDIARRGGRIVRCSGERAGTFVLEAETPLAAIIGYRGWLAGLMEKDDPDVSTWLSRYLPIDDGGPRAA